MLIMREVNNIDAWNVANNITWWLIRAAIKAMQADIMQRFQ
jgi:hypothetical protein